VITQHASLAKTLAYGSFFKFQGSSTINSALNSVTVIRGVVESATSIRCEIVGSSASDSLYQFYESFTVAREIVFTSTSTTTIRSFGFSNLYIPLISGYDRYFTWDIDIQNLLSNPGYTPRTLYLSFFPSTPPSSNYFPDFNFSTTLPGGDANWMTHVTGSMTKINNPSSLVFHAVAGGTHFQGYWSAAMSGATISAKLNFYYKKII